LPPLAFVNFVQNHDQIGNRALGDRLAGSVEPMALEAALAVTLLAPTIPLLFMGEEWGSTRPFPFFCDFTGNLAEAVRSGRRREFAEAYERYGDDIPDPIEEATLRKARLDWQASTTGPGERRLALVRELLAVRHRRIIPRLVGTRFSGADAGPNGLLTARWRMGDGTILGLVANLSGHVVTVTHPGVGTVIWGRELTGSLPPWTLNWRLE
jgi:maltooligosyltrehalose trehalohydrolase